MNASMWNCSVFFYWMTNASFVVSSWLSCVCKLDNLFFKTFTPISTIFSGRRAPLDSTLKKNLFGFASQLYSASTEKYFFEKLCGSTYKKKFAELYIDHRPVRCVHFSAIHPASGTKYVASNCPDRIRSKRQPSDSIWHVPCRNLSLRTLSTSTLDLYAVLWSKFHRYSLHIRCPHLRDVSTSPAAHANHWTLSQPS